jgi:hypothetical protein
MFAFHSRIFILSAAAALYTAAHIYCRCIQHSWLLDRHTRIYISPAYSLLTSVYCRTAVVFGRFLYCVCVCVLFCAAGRPSPSSTSSAFLFLSLFRWHCRSPDSLFQSLIYTYGKLIIIATVFIIISTIYAEKYPQYF